MAKAVKLGSKVKDRITGIIGTATARTCYLHSTAKVLVECKLDANGDAKEFWLEEKRLIVDNNDTDREVGF